MSKLDYHINHHQVPVTAQEFPCLLQHKSTHAVWLFTSIDVATCITGIEISRVRDNCSLVCYKPFYGEVTLTQE